MKLSATDLLAQIRAKHASSTPEATDPGEKGKVTIPEDPALKQEPSEKGKTNPKNPEDVSPDSVNPAKGPAASQLGDTPPATGKGEVTEHPDSPSSAKLAASQLLDRLRGIDPKQASAPKPSASTTAAKPAVNPADPKQAAQNADYSQDTLAKLASLALSTESGAVALTEAVEMAVGQAETQQLLKEAVEQAFIHTARQEEELEKMAAAQALAEAIEEEYALLDGVYQHLTKDATEREMQTINSLTKLIARAEAEYAEQPELFKAAMAAIEDAGAMMEGVNPETGDPAEGEEAPGLPGGGEGPLPDDEILKLIDEALANGDITPEQAGPLVEALTGGEGEEADPREAMLDEALAE